MMFKMIAITATLTVAGCASVPKEKVVVKTLPTEVTKPPLTLPEIAPPNVREVKWIVITRDNYESVFKELEVTGQPVILFALTEKGYKSLKSNDAELLAYIKKQKSVLIAYKGYYEPTKKKGQKR